MFKLIKNSVTGHCRRTCVLNRSDGNVMHGKLLAAAAAAMSLSPVAFAESATGAVSVTLENDAFTGSDDAYSNGFGLTWTSREAGTLSSGNPVRMWADGWSVMPGVSDPSADRFVTVSLVQEIHTPEDITLIDPPRDGRPYAGFLYLDSVVHRRTSEMSDSWTLRVGVVGPASQADETQTWFHDLIGSDEPMGWGTQLPDEMILNIGYTANFSGPTGKFTEHISWRITPMVTAEVGTYATVAGAGALLEFGYNMPQSVHGVSSLRNGLSSTSVVGWDESERDLSLTGNIGIVGFAVERFMPLDGTFFRDSRSVEYDPYTSAVTFGITLRKGDLALNFNLAFSEANVGDRSDVVEFGALTLSRRF